MRGGSSDAVTPLRAHGVCNGAFTHSRAWRCVAAVVRDVGLGYICKPRDAATLRPV